MSIPARYVSHTGITFTLYFRINPNYLILQATEAGAEIVQPIQEQFWGDRYGQIRDPFGYRWGLAQHVRDVPVEEVARVAATIFGDH